MITPYKLFQEIRSVAMPEKWFIECFTGGTKTNAGVTINADVALNYITFYSCVRVLTDTLASLPLIMYQRLPDGGKKKATEHPLYNILHSYTNPRMTSFIWRQVGEGHLATWGNFYCFKDVSVGQKIKGLYPLVPNKMVKVTLKDDQTLDYEYQLKYGTKHYSSEQILHIPGFGYDGVIGYSPVTLAREAIGLGMALEEFGARFFGSGAHPGGIVEYPKKLSDTGIDNFKKGLKEAYGGLGKAHELMVLEEGLKYTQVGIPPEDAQFLESRKYQRSEIASFFRIPPHMIGDLEKATFSNIEQQSLDFATHTMRPWLVLWEQELSRSLLTDSEKEEYFFEFNLDGLLRGDTLARYQAYQIGKNCGWLSPNDIREKENMNPIEGGDKYQETPAGAPKPTETVKPST